MEVPDHPEDGILKVGYSDGLFGRSKSRTGGAGVLNGLGIPGAPPRPSPRS